MKQLLRKRPSAGAIALVIAVLVTLGGVAIAAILDGNGVIHACYNKKSGNLRVTDPGNTDPKAKPKACNAKAESALSWNQTGPQGQRGDTGNTGATGPAGSSPPPDPPAPYPGLFALQIDGSSPVTLSSFAGCYDKQLRVEYQDCYFQIKGVTDDIEQWLADTARGEGTRHNLTVLSMNGNQVLSQVEITGGFLSDFRVVDAEATSSAVGTVDFVVVPQEIQNSAGGSTIARVSPTGFAVSNFSLAIDGVDGSKVLSVGGLHMTVPKNLASGSGRHQFDPGHPQFDDLKVTAASPGATVDDLDSWATNVASGDQDVRQGAIKLRNTGFQTVATLNLSDMSPTSALEPFGTHRSISFSIGGFSF